MRILKKLFVFFTLLISSIFANNTEKDSNNLIVGTTSGYAPYVSLDKEGKYEGFDIDMANLIALKLNKKMIIKDCGNMPGLMIALKQGKVDILLWAISITEERLKNMDLIYYQGEKTTTIPFLFWNNIPEGIKTIADLGNDPKKIVCVEAGTFQEDVLKKHPNLNIKYIDKIDDAIMEIRYGKSFATTLDSSLLPRFKNKYPQIKVIFLSLAPSEQTLGYGICISKNSQLTNQVKKAIEELSADGAIKELEKKWGLANL
ncbi:MAG: transporter substrate-binding domain-containing protein [Chlamydiae bacterium]|nr:transporter substrate-binding domain-containing protein [Chlamydiota bacterium]